MDTLMLTVMLITSVLVIFFLLAVIGDQRVKLNQLEGQLQNQPIRNAIVRRASHFLTHIPEDITGEGDKPNPKVLRWLTMSIILTGDTWSLDKLGQYIGFVQGALYQSGWRDTTSEFEGLKGQAYLDAYLEAGLTVPKSKEVEDG